MSNLPLDLVDSDVPILLSALQQRANDLYEDLKAYQTCLQAHSRQHDVELRSFKRGIESEVKALRTVSLLVDNVSKVSTSSNLELEEIQARRFHALRSSNLPFYEAIWTVARQCKGITALGKRVYCQGKVDPREKEGSNHHSSNGPANRQTKDEKKSAVVDIVAQDGLEWIKVSTITEKRLLFEMAKEGWEGYGDKSDREEYSSDTPNMLNKDKAHEPRQLELVKLAKVLYRASRETRVHFRHPHVRFIFPKIHEGAFDDVDAMLADIRSLGIEVVCGSSSSSSSIGQDSTTTVPSLEDLTLTSKPRPKAANQDLTHLLPSTSVFNPAPTQTLNIDCTILLALISDISHIPAAALPPYPDNTSGHYHKAITRQINSELTSPLLPTEVYPLLSGRDLVCTNEAAQRMREIVQTMGTASETVRADIFVAEHSHHDTSAEGALRNALMGYSCHDVPSQLRLPIRVVDFDIDQTTTAADEHLDREVPLSSLSLRVMRRTTQALPLSSINKSVFLYGWHRGVVTVTSNRVVAHGLVKCINEILDEEENLSENRVGLDDDDGRDFEGPLVYVCETARSLIGKEKQVKRC